MNREIILILIQSLGLILAKLSKQFLLNKKWENATF